MAEAEELFAHKNAVSLRLGSVLAEKCNETKKTAKMKHFDLQALCTSQHMGIETLLQRT